MILGIILSLLAILITINLIQLKYSSQGSDHYAHFTFIKAVRNNKNRFISENPVYINKNDIPPTVPQFFYWILSHIPAGWLNKNYSYIGLIINIVSFGCFIFFLYLLKPFLNTDILFNTILFSA